jgi:hypothetical protein
MDTMHWFLLACMGCATPSQDGTETSRQRTDSGESDSAAGDVDAPTWTGEVGSIVMTHCTGCHDDSGVAFPLNTYVFAASVADAVATAVSDRTMPPWGLDASGDCQEFSNLDWLSEEEIDLVVEWAAAGAPEGSGAPPPQLAQPPDLDEVDLEFDWGEDFEAEVGDGELWQCFVIDLDPGQMEYLVGAAFSPSDPAMVHHGVLYTLQSKAAEEAVRAADEADPNPGYDCGQGVMTDEFRVVAMYNPGTPPTVMPEGTGLSLKTDQPLLVRMHYQKSGTDRTVVQLDLSDEVDRPAFILAATNNDFVLEAGQDEVTVVGDMTLADMGAPGDSTFFGVNPHMHTYGAGQSLVLDPEGEAECLASVPHWDPDWQQLYWYTDSRDVGRDEVMRLTCTFDTSGSSTDIGYGQSYADEMCVTAIYVTPTASEDD